MASSVQNLEDLTITWLDVDQIHENVNDYLETKTRLRQCNSYSEIYNDENECIQAIMANENVFLIVSGSIFETFIPRIVNFKQIIFIYILCSNPNFNGTSQLKDTSKLRGVFSDKSELIEKVKKDIKFHLKSLIPISIIDEKSVRALNKEYCIFMWTQLLIDVLTQIPQTDYGKIMMLNDCRQYYANSKQQLQMIAEFEREYETDFAIWWYTRDCFLFKQLNKALRTQNIDIIFKYRFFITDLSEQLKQLYNENISSLEETLIVYRGQTISGDEFKKIEQSIDGLISMNTFLSTTRKKNLALAYAGNGSDRPLFESVLFEITIDKSISTKTKPFADITDMSSFGLGEEEILLSLGSIFKIQSVERLVGDGIVWQVKLILNESIVNKEIDMLFSYLKMNSTTSISNIGTLGLLLSQMGNYMKAKRYYEIMLNELPSDHSAVPVILNNIGLSYHNKGYYEEALKYYEKSHEGYKKQNNPENALLLASLYNNMGSLYYEENDNKRALDFIQKAFEICRNSPSRASYLLSASLFIVMSGIYEDDDNFDTELGCLNNALEIQLKILPLNHFEIAATYNNIGGVYLRKGDYTKALQIFETALDIGSKSLPATHENIRTYLEHIKITKERISQIRLIPNQHYTIKVLLGEEIQNLIKNKDKQSGINDCYRIPIDDLLKETTAIGLYFCPCSTVLTHLQSNQHLIEVYRKILTDEGEKKLPFEIIFMSYRDDEESKTVFKIMPWTAVEYKTDKQWESRKAIEEYLGSYLFIKAQPILIILKTLTGEVLSKNGVEAIDSMKFNAIETWCNGNRVLRPSTNAEEKQFIWKSVRCDGCQRAPLVGLRYKCKACPDYDLCETCKNATDHEHHEFILISKPEEYY